MNLPPPPTPSKVTCSAHCLYLAGGSRCRSLSLVVSRCLLSSKVSDGGKCAFINRDQSRLTFEWHQTSHRSFLLIASQSLSIYIRLLLSSGQVEENKSEIIDLVKCCHFVTQLIEFPKPIVGFLKVAKKDLTRFNAILLPLFHCSLPTRELSLLLLLLFLLLFPPPCWSLPPCPEAVWFSGNSFAGRTQTDSWK